MAAKVPVRAGRALRVGSAVEVDDDGPVAVLGNHPLGRAVPDGHDRTGGGGIGAEGQLGAVVAPAALPQGRVAR